MKVLVTGATGLLGNNLVRMLLQEGYNVKCMLRQSSDDSPLKGLSIEIVRGSLLNDSDLEKALDGCEVVIHAAARTEQFPVDFKYYKEPNVTATKKLITASKKKGIERFVFVSTANVFGPGTKEEPGTEWSEFSHFRLGSGYINSKYLAQEIVMMEAEKNRFPAVIVNPTFIIGAYDHRPSSGKMILHVLRNPIVFYPAGGKNFVHVNDVASGIIKAIEKGRIGESYLLAGENLSYIEFFKKVMNLSGKKRSLVKLHPRALLTAGRVGDAVSFIKPVALNSVNSKLLNLDNYYSPRKAIKELGLPQTPIDRAIEDALMFYKERF